MDNPKNTRSEPIEILLADDNDDDVVLLRESLEEAKLVNLLQVVRDGEEAMAYLRRQGPYAHARRPGMVMLDINMPKKNGFEVLTELKRDPSLSQIPVIILTTSQRDEDVVRSYKNGACSFISKPLSLEKLHGVIRQFEIYWALVCRIPDTKEKD